MVGEASDIRFTPDVRAVGRWFLHGFVDMHSCARHFPPIQYEVSSLVTHIICRAFGCCGHVTHALAPPSHGMPCRCRIQDKQACKFVVKKVQDKLGIAVTIREAQCKILKEIDYMQVGLSSTTIEIRPEICILCKPFFIGNISMQIWIKTSVLLGNAELRCLHEWTLQVNLYDMVFHNPDGYSDSTMCTIGHVKVRSSSCTMNIVPCSPSIKKEKKCTTC